MLEMWWDAMVVMGVVGYSGMLWNVMGCSGIQQDVVGYSGMQWNAFGCNWM